MAVQSYICFNGEFIKENEFRIAVNNRAFRYGDSLVENIHGFATEPQFLELHLERLTDNMRFLCMEVPAFFSERNFSGLITSLLNKNRVFGGARIRLTVIRSEGEEFLTPSGKVSFLIESDALQQGRYVLNERGLVASLFTDMAKNADTLAHLRSNGLILYRMAMIRAKERNTDAIILLNQAGRIIETADSNIFLVSGNSVFTPGYDQGCVHGIMRRVVISLATSLGYNVNDHSSLTPGSLYEAEEVFITNATEGIRWIGAYEQTRYFNRVAKMLTAKLNEKAFEKV